MVRSRCRLAAFLFGLAFLEGAPAAQQYDPRQDILRAKIRAMGAGFVGNVKSATADTVTVISDGSYSVIPKGEELTFQVTPGTAMSQMTEGGQFKNSQPLHAKELRPGQFIGVVEDTQNFRSDRHIAQQIYALLAGTVAEPSESLATTPPPPPSDMSPAMRELYRSDTRIGAGENSFTDLNLWGSSNRLQPTALRSRQTEIPTCG